MRQRLKTLALLGAAALLLHAAALGGLQWTWAQRPPLPAAVAVATPAASAPLLQLRVVTPEAAPPATVEAALPAAPEVAPPAASLAASFAASPAPLRGPAPPARSVAAATAVPAKAAAPQGVNAPAPPPVEPLLALTVAPVAPVAPVSHVVPVASVASVAAAASSAAPHDVPPMSLTETTLPHYRTQAPPPTLLRYALQRGVLRGSGELRWRPDGGHYELQLDGRVGPLSVLTQLSSGGFDAAGLAPQRFTDKRLRRPTAAVNFQREAGKITFSGPSTEFPLRAGMQDRLSWMVQLAAIVSAEPALRKAGAMVLMGVVGVNADPAVWAFRCVGREAVDTEAGGVSDALKYVRDPHDLHDTTVQVWLDPQRHYLPIHATQKSGPSDEEFSLRLLESTAIP